MQPNIIHKSRNSNNSGTYALCGLQGIIKKHFDWEKVTCRNCLILRHGIGPVKIELIEPLKTLIPVGLTLWLAWARKVLRLK